MRLRAEAGKLDDEARKLPSKVAWGNAGDLQTPVARAILAPRLFSGRQR